MKGNFVAEYRAQLTLSQPRCVVTITGSHPADVQNLITQFLGSKSKTTFDAQQNDRTVLVYNDAHLNGAAPIGWIGEYELPASMGIQAVTEQRLNLVQKAA